MNLYDLENELEKNVNMLSNILQIDHCLSTEIGKKDKGYNFISQTIICHDGKLNLSTLSTIINFSSARYVFPCIFADKNGLCIELISMFETKQEIERTWKSIKKNR